MTSTAEEPSQAERLEAVADAGPGADDKEITGDPLSEKPTYGGSTTASSDVVEEAKAEEKPAAAPGAPERSSGKIALIMGSLCVREPVSRL